MVIILLIELQVDVFAKLDARDWHLHWFNFICFLTLKTCINLFHSDTYYVGGSGITKIQWAHLVTVQTMVVTHRK